MLIKCNTAAVSTVQSESDIFFPSQIVLKKGRGDSNQYLLREGQKK